MARVVGKSAQYWSSFSPSNLPGLTLWYDFSDRSTLDLSGEYQITRIRDKSGKGCGATPSNPANSYWIYDAVNNGVMRTPVTTSNNFVTDICLNASTLYFSGATVLSGTGGNTVYVFGGKEPGCAWFRTNGVGAYSFGQTNNFASSLTNVADCNAMSVGSFTGGGFPRAATNGVVEGSVTAYANPPQVRSGIPLILGTYNLSTIRNYGSMYELLLFSNILTDSERAALEEYLIEKWMINPDPPATITAPTDISGCNLWLDTSGGTSNFVFVPGTSNISKWIDKSPCNYDVSAANTTTCPIWQDVSQYVYFNATINPVLYTAHPEPSRGEETGFIVGIRGASTASYRGLINAKTPILGPWRQIGVVGSYANRLNNASPAVGQFGAAESIGDGNAIYVLHELCWRIKGKEYFSRMGGQASCYKTTPNWIDISAVGTTTIGTGDHYFREIILYDRALSFSEISNVTAYLTQKWGLSNYKTLNRPPTSNRAYGSSSPFARPFQVPYDIANCTLWLDAKDSNTIELDASGNVLRWLDKSGWGNDVSASASRPSYSNETLVFNSNVMTVRNSNQSALNFRFDPPFHMRFHTMVALHKPASATGNTSLIDFSFTGTATCNVSFPTIDGSLNPRGYVNSSASAPSANRATSKFLENSLTTEYNIITASIQSNGFTVYRNGIIQQDASAIVGNNITFAANTTLTSIGRWGNPGAVSGTQTWYQGEVKEIFMFDRAISTYSVAQIESYLAKKWNLTSILPSNHLVFSNEVPITVNTAPESIDQVGLWVDAFSYVGEYSNNATITTNWSNRAYKPSAVVPTGTPKFLTNAWQGRPGIDMTSGSFATTFVSDVSLTALAHQTFIVASYNTGAPNTTRDALFFRSSPTTNPKHSALQVRPLDTSLGTTFTTAAGAATGGSYRAPNVTAGTPFLFEIAAGPTVVWWATNGETFCNTASFTTLGSTLSYGWAGIGQDSSTNTTPTWNGNIHEIITYRTNATNPAVFDNQFRIRIRAYLAQKWGIAGSLPAYPDKGIRV